MDSYTHYKNHIIYTLVPKIESMTNHCFHQVYPQLESLIIEAIDTRNARKLARLNLQLVNIVDNLLFDYKTSLQKSKTTLI